MTKTREQELDDLERELGTPYIHKPDDLEIGTSSLCWMDKDRVCDATCAAYNVSELGPNGEIAQGSQKCMILSAISDLPQVITLLRHPKKPVEHPPAPHIPGL